MRLIDAVCDQCGAKLKVDLDNKQAICEHCGAQVLIDDEVIHMQYDNAEEAGYAFEKGRQRAQAEVRQTQSRGSYNTAQYRQPPKKSNTWLWVLGWICIFPVPLTIILSRKKDMNLGLRISIIAIAWIVYLIIGLSGKSEDKNKNSTIATDNTVKVESINGDGETETSISVETQNTGTEEPEVESKATEPDKSNLDNFFKAYVEKGNDDNIKEIAEDTGVVIKGRKGEYTVGLTDKDVSTLLGGTKPRDYLISISAGGDIVEYHNNVDFIDIMYSKFRGIIIYDKNRLSAYPDGTGELIVDTVDEAIAYKPDIETDIAPIEQLYEEAEFGMPKGDMEGLISKYGLYREEGRSNSFAWYIYFSKENNATSVYYVVEKNGLNQIDFHDYYVEQKYGVYLKGDKEGYHLHHSETEEPDEFFDTPEEAITALHAYRLK